jgi:hypothetical protein
MAAEGKGVTQATAERCNLNFKPTLEIGGDACFVGAAAHRFGQESTMLESPILDVITVVVIAAVLWSIFRSKVLTNVVRLAELLGKK